MEEILSMGTSALIAYIDGDDQKSRSVFTSFADAHQNRLIHGLTSDLTLAKSNVQEAPFIIVYSPLDQVNPVFKDTFSLDKLEAFTNKYSTPLTGTFSREPTMQGMPAPKYHRHLPHAFTTPSLTFRQAGLPLLHIFVSTPSSSDYSSLLSLLKPIAEKYQSKLNFDTIDTIKMHSSGKR
jgi:hypothetical protein